MCFLKPQFCCWHFSCWLIAFWCVRAVVVFTGPSLMEYVNIYNRQKSQNCTRMTDVVSSLLNWFIKKLYHFNKIANYVNKILLYFIVFFHFWYWLIFYFCLLPIVWNILLWIETQSTFFPTHVEVGNVVCFGRVGNVVSSIDYFIEAWFCLCSPKWFDYSFACFNGDALRLLLFN